MNRGLFVAHKNVAYRVGLEELVVDRQYRPAGISEYDFNALVLQCLENNGGPVIRASGFRVWDMRGVMIPILFDRSFKGYRRQSRPKRAATRRGT